MYPFSQPKIAEKFLLLRYKKHLIKTNLSSPKIFLFQSRICKKIKVTRAEYRLADMWKKIFSIIVIVLLFISVYGSLQLIPSASANLDDSIPVLSMPIEHVNYTITNVNGTLWAKIDGEYPIYIQNQFNGDMPMVYPMPPGTTASSSTTSRCF